MSQRVVVTTRQNTLLQKHLIKKSFEIKYNRCHIVLFSMYIQHYHSLRSLCLFVMPKAGSSNSLTLRLVVPPINIPYIAYYIPYLYQRLHFNLAIEMKPDMTKAVPS